MSAQNWFQCTVKTIDGDSIATASGGRVLNSSRIISCESKSSGADTFIYYQAKNKLLKILLDDTFSAVAGASGYVTNSDKGKTASLNLLERKGDTYAKTLVMQQDSFVMAWADPNDSTKSYLDYDEKPSMNSLEVRYKVNHSLLGLTVQSGDVTTTTTSTSTTSTTTT